MDTDNFEVRIKETVKNWEHGRIPAHQAMEDIRKLVTDWQRLEKLSMIFPGDAARVGV